MCVETLSNFLMVCCVKELYVALYIYYNKSPKCHLEFTIFIDLMKTYMQQNVVQYDYTMDFIPWSKIASITWVLALAFEDGSWRKIYNKKSC